MAAIFSDGSDVFLFVCGLRGDKLLEYHNEVVLFSGGRERQVGQVQAVRVRDYLPPSYVYVTLELVVVQYAAHYVRLVTIEGEHVAHVGCDIHHTVVADGHHGQSVPVKVTFYLFVRGEFVVVY